MPTFPVRGLSKFGVINDVDPFNLPPEAYSFAVNVRFHNGSILRAPVFRTITSSLTYDSPRFLAPNTPTTGFDSVVIGYLNGRVTAYKAGEIDQSVAGYVNVNAESPYTSCRLGDVLYVNRDDRVPWALIPGTSQYVNLTNWPGTWRCKLLRACSGALIALGVTKAGTSRPTMVQTSEFVTAGSVPTTWNDTDPTTNATENILSEMEGPITDAQNLGEVLIIYGLKETWVYQFNPGSADIWENRRLFNDAGAISANCSVEIDRKHYVFGLNDIWLHDGVTKQSICDQRTRDFIFASLNVSKANRCFVSHNPALKELYFNFVSGDRGVSFSGTDGCNRAAVWNYAESNWTYYDLPFVYGSTVANLDTILLYSTVTSTYDTIGGTYLDQEDSLKKPVIMIGDVSAADSLSKSLYAFDLEGPGSIVPLPVDLNATKGWQLERDGLDLDEVGVDLTGYKVLNYMIPQGRIATGAAAIEFAFGSSDYFNQAVTYSNWQTWNGLDLYKLDYNVGGRYLSMKARQNDYRYMNLSGMDYIMDVFGDR